MKERPLLFSKAMVLALLSGNKTQTRRLPRLPLESPEGDWYADRYNHTHEWCFWERKYGMDTGRCTTPLFKSPKGEVGDVFWVRETTRVLGWGHLGEVQMHFPADGAELVQQIPLYGEDRWIWERWNERMCKKTEELGGTYVSASNINLPAGVQFPLTPSILMPRWASRLTLEITGVRLQRLQDISEEDCLAEGVADWLKASGGAFVTYQRAYAALWKQINGEGSWELNPWVWAYDFKRVGA